VANPNGSPELPGPSGVLRDHDPEAQARLPSEQARADVRDLLAWRPVSVGTELLEAGWSVEDRFGLSCWDALIVAAARIAGCEYLLTEDLQHGVELEGLRVVSPFRAAAGSLP
jgi:predicted nucleic acid-binding protein